MYNKFISTLFVLLSFYSFSQDQAKVIDSLKQIIKLKPSDSIKAKVYSDLCWYYRNTSTDSAFYYGGLALGISQKNKNKLGEAQAYNDLGILHYGLAEYSKALEVYEKSLKIRQSLKDSSGIASLHNKIGLVYQNTFKMDSAITHATKALKIYEARNNIRYAAVLKNNIANIYKGLKQYKKALEAHLELAELNKELNDAKALVKSYNNIANAYLHLTDTVNSTLYYKKGIELAKINNFKTGLAALYNNYGSLLQSKGEYGKALKSLEESLRLRQELDDRFGIASSSIRIGGLYLDMKAFNKVERNLRLGLKLSEEFNANELKVEAYDKLAYYYAYQNKTDSVIHYRELFKTLKDSLYSKQVLNEIANVQEKYNASEREKEILGQRADIAEKELNLNKKNTQLIGLIILAIAISLLGYMLFKQQKLKNEQLKKESELKEALVKIETQNKLQEQRLRISRDLHDNIGAQLTFIISSIENLQYGFKIKNKKLNSKLLSISAFTKDTIYELRDTIWAMNKNVIYLEDLETRISNFIDKADMFSNNLTFEFKIDKSIDKSEAFTSVKGMNIYRIIQEAINNAIKYAEASMIKVDILKQDKNIQFKITDNGKGFEKNNLKKGNGLNNMKKRAKEIGADIDIDSKLNKGTEVLIIMCV